jgi:hypothetical protein
MAAGADMNAEDKENETPFTLATVGSPCRSLLREHATVLAVIKADPAELLSSVLFHCAALSDFKDAVSKPLWSLNSYHLDPFFLWASRNYRSMVFSWARSTFIVQLAAMTQPLDELPDDCAGDIIEYLEIDATRTESMRIASHCSSPKAHAWVYSVVTAAVVVSIEHLFSRQTFLLPRSCTVNLCSLPA